MDKYCEDRQNPYVCNNIKHTQKEEENNQVNCENGKCVGKDIYHLDEEKLIVLTAIAKRW